MNNTIVPSLGELASSGTGSRPCGDQRKEAGGPEHDPAAPPASSPAPALGSREVRAIRQTILELLFAEHRGVCTTCDKNGDCRLQKYGYEYQIADTAFAAPETNGDGKNDTTGNEAIRYRPGKCIRCGRCIRICQEVQMDNALTFKDRAAWVEVSTAFGMPLNDSTCVLCGQCISTCPTGALYERAAEGKGQAKDLTRTTCIYCGVGCQIDLNVNGVNEIVRVTSPVGVVPNNGNLCVKGRFGMEFVRSDKRLTTPLIKRMARSPIPSAACNACEKPLLRQARPGTIGRSLATSRARWDTR